jgi:hypothetical protein
MTATGGPCTWGGTKVMPLVFFNVTAITMKFTWIIHTSFAIVWLFSHNVHVIFNTTEPILSKVLYTNVVKFPALTLEHITKTLFQFTVI